MLELNVNRRDRGLLASSLSASADSLELESAESGRLNPRIIPVIVLCLFLCSWVGTGTWDGGSGFVAVDEDCTDDDFESEMALPLAVDEEEDVGNASSSFLTWFAAGSAVAGLSGAGAPNGEGSSPRMNG